VRTFTRSGRCCDSGKACRLHGSDYYGLPHFAFGFNVACVVTDFVVDSLRAVYHAHFVPAHCYTAALRLGYTICSADRLDYHLALRIAGCTFCFVPRRILPLYHVYCTVLLFYRYRFVYCVRLRLRLLPRCALVGLLRIFTVYARLHCGFCRCAVPFVSRTVYRRCVSISCRCRLPPAVGLPARFAIQFGSLTVYAHLPLDCISFTFRVTRLLPRYPVLHIYRCLHAVPHPRVPHALRLFRTHHHGGFSLRVLRS